MHAAAVHDPLDVAFDRSPPRTAVEALSVRLNAGRNVRQRVAAPGLEPSKHAAAPALPSPLTLPPPCWASALADTMASKVDLTMPQLPVYHTDPIVLANAKSSANPNGWADPDDANEATLRQRNTWKDGVLTSLLDAGIAIDAGGKPCNPFEPLEHRRGRYLLGKWGPNHAADPILTAEPSNPGGPWRVLVVTRGDCGLSALPGGMIDDEENEDMRGYTRTIQREIVEEAAEESGAVQRALAKGEVVYTGYVHDPRNTHNAWIETVAVWGHLTAEEADALVLRPAADGETTTSYWMDMVDDGIDEMYASHPTWVHTVQRKLAAGDRPRAAGCPAPLAAFDVMLTE